MYRPQLVTSQSPSTENPTPWPLTPGSHPVVTQLTLILVLLACMQCHILVLNPNAFRSTFSLNHLPHPPTQAHSNLRGLLSMLPYDRHGSLVYVDSVGHIRMPGLARLGPRRVHEAMKRRASPVQLLYPIAFLLCQNPIILDRRTLSSLSFVHIC